MTVQITIVGLGQIGTSVGLALADHKDILYRVGHDREISIAKHAQKLGALDKTMINLPSAVKDADLVLLSLPMDQMRETLSVIALDLKPGAVVMDTGPVKQVMAGWAQEILPEERYYVGLTPVINPKYLHNIDSGVEAAHKDLFRDGLMAIVAPSGVPSEALKLAVDLTRLLGAEMLFADLLEIDGLMATTHALPQLMAAALLDATVDQPGWLEGRKVAGRSYAEVAGTIHHPTSADSLSSTALLNRENVVRVIDGVIASLQTIRNEIDQEQSDALIKRLVSARGGYDEWWRQRQTSEWVGEGVQDFESPKTSDLFGQLLGMRKRREDKE